MHHAYRGVSKDPGHSSKLFGRGNGDLVAVSEDALSVSQATEEELVPQDNLRGEDACVNDLRKHRFTCCPVSTYRGMDRA